MTVYTLNIQQSNIASLPVGSKLTYDDTVLPEHTSIHVAYLRVVDHDNVNHTYLIAIPHHIAKTYLLEQAFLQLHSEAELPNLLNAALAKQNNSQWPALILENPGIAFSQLIRDEQRINIGAAERTAIDAWIQYLSLLRRLIQPNLDDPLTEMTIQLPFVRASSFYWDTKQQQLNLPYWDAVSSCNGSELSWVVRQSAYLWYQFLCQRIALPRDIMSSERWHPPDNVTSLGTMSLGLRLIVWHNLHNGFGQDWENLQETITRLIDSLQTWLSLLSKPPDEVTDTKHLESLWKAYKNYGIATDNTVQLLILEDLRLRLKSTLDDGDIFELQERLNAYADTIASHPDSKSASSSDSLWILMNYSDTQQYVEKIKLALVNNDDSEARYLLRQLIAHDVGGDSLVLQEFISFFDTLAIYRQSEKHIISAFERMQRLSSQQLVNQTPGLVGRIAHATKDLVDDAVAILNRANTLKTWQAIQQAHAARRILQYQDGYRSFIDDMRVYAPDMPQWQTIDVVLHMYTELRDLFLQLMQMSTTQALQKLSQNDHDSGSQQATSVLALMQKALEKGIDIGEIMDDSDSMREQWRKLVDDAMNTLQDSTTMRNAISSVESQLEQNISRLGKQLETLQQKIDEDPDDINTKINQLYGELRHLQEQSNEQQSGISINTEKVARVARLLDDVKERFDNLSGELSRTQHHAAGILSGYLDWFSKQKIASTTDETLEKVDELVYAMRQCPVSAYNPKLHQTWVAKFEEQTERYQLLHEAKAKRLRGRRLRNFMNEAKEQQQRFVICRKEATNKLEGFKKIHPDSEG